MSSVWPGRFPLLFALVVLLAAVLLFRNARYAVRRYFTDRNRMLLSVYLGFLVVFGWLVLHLAYRVMEMIELSRESDVLEATPYVSRRLHGNMGPPPAGEE